MYLRDQSATNNCGIIESTNKKTKKDSKLEKRYDKKNSKYKPGGKKRH